MKAVSIIGLVIMYRIMNRLQLHLLILSQKRQQVKAV